MYLYQGSLLPGYVFHTARGPPSMYINSTHDSGFQDWALGLSFFTKIAKQFKKQKEWYRMA
jgi:hypothetical protein